ncbi:MAG: L-threonylcarbamoyladenylate synthase [Candidatus Avelusimicrobium sp.]|uniref:L-threonylcarbamoyladenylate synthase n=1 Tax=Candidatus Avelusimicrobium sp. TaxID=3048833 RepID=UPI003F07062E
MTGKTRIFNVSDVTPEAISLAAREIEDGAVAVVPTDTVYGIGTGAFCEASIERIYKIKERPATSPLQLLTGSLEQARKTATFTPAAERLAQAFWPGGLTMILPPSEKGRALTRGFAGLGLRIPGNVFLVSLLSAMEAPLACTSANLHGQPVLTAEADVLKTFDGKVDFIFLGGSLSPTASSVADLTAEPILLREGSVPRAELERVWGGPFRVK